MAEWIEGMRDCTAFVVFLKAAPSATTASCRVRRGKVCGNSTVCKCHVPCEAVASMSKDLAETVEGGFPSERKRPVRSLIDGMLACVRAQVIELTVMD